VELLEREHSLRALGEYAADAAAGRGRLLLLAGEAGVGKTALLEAFRERRTDLRWWWSACDGSFTPRPLGPLYEIGLQAGGRLRAMCANNADRRELFAAFLAELVGSDALTVVVVEDLHWADDATLDWLRYVSRRVGKTRALVVVSYRDDDPGDDDVLRAVIGQIAAHDGARRLALPPLSQEAVRCLAGDRRDDAEQLYRLTGGVPFYVREVLNAAPGEVPRTVADVVAARMARLSPQARQLLSAAAVLARPVDAHLLMAVAESGSDILDECLASGTLVGGPVVYRFRHELTRLAVERAVPAHGRSRLHAAALAALRAAAPGDHARLAHHAEAAGRAGEALRYATRAAADAVALHSNREAAAQFRRALRCAEGSEPAVRAALHEGLATALALMDHWEESAQEREAALALRRQLGEPLKISENLRGLARCLWRLCRGEESERAAHEALTLMSGEPASAEAAWAWALYAASISEMCPGDQALDVARQGLRLAEAAGCAEAVAYSLNTIGTVEIGVGRDGFAELVRSIELARRHRLVDAMGRGYSNLYQAAADRFRFTEYAWAFTEGIAYAQDNDTATYTVCLRGSHATVLLRTGRLGETAALAEDTLRETISPVNRLHLLIPLAAARLRQGDPRADAALEQAWQLALGTGEPGWLLRVAVVQAEAAWLTGRAGALDVRVPGVVDGVGADANPWLRGELGMWLDRLGVPRRGPAPPLPYALELDGEYLAAARWWHEAGCPLEEALASIRAPGPGHLATALELVTAIGAERVANRLRRMMRDAGERSVPRGARPATRAHPDGLTPRQVEVLDLLREGMTNAAIARRLYISERTVHHHVSAVLGKLGVSSRTELAGGSAAGAAAQPG
jgi:DNA-binding CsgD family transcriptional regulator/tetratricopeptide (TPR) repeat protein